MGNDKKMAAKESSSNNTIASKGTKETDKKNDIKHDNKSKQHPKKK